MRTKIEYRVRPVVRFVVTRFVEQDELVDPPPGEARKRSRSSEVLGECQHETAAHFMAERMGVLDKLEAEKYGRDDEVLVNDEKPIY